MQRYKQMQLSQVLIDRKKEIIQRWMVRVRHDDAISSDRPLSYSETLDSLPDIIDAIARLLTTPRLDDVKALWDEGMSHGKERARQGYDAEEIVWEYAILREVVLEIIARAIIDDQTACPPLMLFKLVGTVNSAIDKVIAFSMKRYADERLSELNMLYGELITSNQELDRIVRSEQSNMAHLAHEIKSPLSSIIGYSDLFLRRHSSEGAIHTEYIEQVLTGGRRLLGTINNALEISSYRAGKVSLAIQTVNACEVVSEVVTALKIMAQQKGLRLSVECSVDKIQLSTDKARLRQVVTNLVSNAIRYTEKGRIQVHIRLAPASPDSSEKQVEIEVQDTGQGIHAAEQGRIFEPYYQGEAGQQLQSSTGLGLAITNQIVRLLQGKIHLKSEVGVGSTFTITLPLKIGNETEASGSNPVEAAPKTASQAKDATSSQSTSQQMAAKSQVASS